LSGRMLPGQVRLRHSEPIEPKAVTAVGKAVNAAEHRRYCPQACAPCNQEHHEDLVFDRLGRRHAAEDLPGHHARQRNDAG